MVLVSNSSPIIHLAKINKLSLLKDLYGKLFVPQKVYSECTDTRYYQNEVKLINNADWLQVKTILDYKLFSLLNSELDAGEAEALILAMELNADLILLDDKEARVKGRILDIRATGTLGVLIKAKQKCLIDSLEVNITQLQDSGFRLSPNLIAKVLSETQD